MRRRYTYWLAVADFLAFNLVSFGLVYLRPEIKAIYGDGLLADIFPVFISIILVSLLALFRQYRFRPRDRFYRQYLGAFNVVTLGFLLIIIISLDIGGAVSTERGNLVLFLCGLLVAAALSRIAIYYLFGRRPDFSLKEPVILKSENGRKARSSQPLVLDKRLRLADIKKQIDASMYDFAIMTDDDGYFAGTINDGDIIEAALKAESPDAQADDLINKSYPVAREILSAVKIRHMMIERNLRYLPLLTNDGKPSRVVVLSDLDRKYPDRKKIDRSKRVLIIGGAGYIGSVMTRYLLKRGYHVAVLDNLMFGYDALAELDNHPAYRFFNGDARNIQDLLTAMDGIDHVIHLAAIVGDPACALDPRATIDINYEASKIMVDACLHKKVKRLLFASSCSVYGAADNGELLTETSPLNPVSLYAETRLRSEEAILNRAEAPLAVTMFRLSTVFGFSYRPRFDLVVNVLTARALIDGEISIFGGSQWRPNIHVIDVVRGFVAGVESPVEKMDRQIFNLGSESENYRISQLGELVRDALPGTKIKTVDAEMDRRDYRVGFEKIEQALNYKATMSVPDGIREIINAYRKNKFGHYSEDRYSNFKLLGG